MDKYMKANIRMIKNMVMELSYGQTVENMLANGRKVDNMAKVNTIFPVSQNAWVNGYRVKEFVGLFNELQNYVCSIS